MYGLVSIIMPSYNTAQYIGESIKSVISQTYSNWELIIVDDCSTDNTDEVVGGFQDNRIKYIKNEKNSGAAVSRNRALREVKGEWIAFLDSDDLWFPQKLEKQLGFMKENGCYFSCTRRATIGEDGKELGTYVTSPKHVTKRGMLIYCWPGCSSVMYHVPTVGLIQIADLKKNNDYAMWLKVIKKTDFYYLDDCLELYRVRKQSISHDKFSKLLKSHYLLFHQGENMGILKSSFFACLNLFGGVYKKLFLVHKYEKQSKGETKND